VGFELYWKLPENSRDVFDYWEILYIQISSRKKYRLSLSFLYCFVGYVTTGYPAGYTTAYGQTYPVAGYYLSGL